MRSKRRAVGPGRRQGKRHEVAEDAVRHLDEDAGPVPGAGVRPAGAPVLQVDQEVEGLSDDVVGAVPLDVRHEADAARVVLVTRPVQSQVAAFSTGRCAHMTLVENALESIQIYNQSAMYSYYQSAN